MRFAAGLFCLTIAATLARVQTVSIYAGGDAGFPNAQPSNDIGVRVLSGGASRFAPDDGSEFIMLVNDRLAVDVEALFRPIRYETRRAAPRITSFDTIHATALEIPVIVSYHFASRRRFRPFAGAGVVPYERFWGRDDAHSIIHDQGDLETHVVFPFYGFTSDSKPLVLSAGAAYAKSRWLIRPEIRYTHSSGSSARRPDHGTHLSA